MSTPPDPPPPPPDPPPGEPESKVRGVVAGVLTPIAAIAAALLGQSISTTNGIYALVGFLVVMLVGILLWRKLPGFGLGIAWFFGVAVVTFTACTIIVVNAFR
ncbi:MAG: hypothetical protein R3246_15945 [Acidimicrobiia bacterium]|nr:hypothetical protein [Acidimicrobiia bacterium]